MYNASLNCQHFHSLSINSSFPVCCSAGIAAEGLALAAPRERSPLGCTGADFQLARLHQRPTSALHTRALRWCPYPGRLPSPGQARASRSSRKLLGSHSSMDLPSQEPICTSLLLSCRGHGRPGCRGTRLDLLKTCPQSGLVQADAVCALCTQATCTRARKRSLSNVAWLNDLPAEYVLSHLVSSTHLELMKASTGRSWKNAHSANPSQHGHSLPGFASRLLPLCSRRRQLRVCVLPF